MSAEHTYTVTFVPAHRDSHRHCIREGVHHFRCSAGCQTCCAEARAAAKKALRSRRMSDEKEPNR